jgi:hypothetical protein
MGDDNPSGSNTGPLAPDANGGHGASDAPPALPNSQTFLVTTFDLSAYVVEYGMDRYFNSYTFVVPNYTTLRVQLWGGGATAIYSGSTLGGDTTFGSLKAGGGGAGQYQLYQGGVASGGDTNLNGGPGTAGVGGSAPYGGAGGSSATCNYGELPGGGSATGGATPGGGGGAYAEKTYAPGDLTPGSLVTVTVGVGGGYSSPPYHPPLCNGLMDIYTGANGEAYISWL